MRLVNLRRQPKIRHSIGFIFHRWITNYSEDSLEVDVSDLQIYITEIPLNYIDIYGYGHKSGK